MEDIKENWIMLSLNNKFHALLATDSIPEAIAYYRLLRKEMPALKVTALLIQTLTTQVVNSLRKRDLLRC